MLRVGGHGPPDGRLRGATGTVSVTANAASNAGVSKVEFYVNNVLQSTDTSTPYLYSWNTSSLAAGTYTLMAKAYDSVGGLGQSANVSVSVVKDTTSPTVSVAAPTAGSTVSGTAAIAATAADDIGVSKVEFYDNGALLSATNVAPYRYNWDTTSAADGSHTLTAKAYDAAGNVGTSSPVTVTINNAVAVTRYTISASSGSGGSISPAGPVTVASGSSQTFNIAAGTGYKIAAVTVDGASVGALSSYTFSNVAANHTIAASFVSSTSTSGAAPAAFAVNSGGPQFVSSSAGTYQADSNYSGGSVTSTTATVSGTSDAPLYQTGRYGNFSYSTPIANGNYMVTLKFMENYWSAAGKRVFDVTLNGTTAISNLDVYAKVGKNAAYDVTVPVTVTGGTLTIGFVSKIDNARVSAIKVAPSAAFAVNSGGSQFVSSTGLTYKADSNYSGGSVTSTTATVSGTTDGPLYQTGRYGNFSYSTPLANGNYAVTLKFMENYWTAAGRRVFDVTIGGNTVISNLDVYAKAGKNTAYDVTVPASVTNGTLTIGFVSKVDNARVSAIQVMPSQ